jgi:hypothetical protein
MNEAAQLGMRSRAVLAFPRRPAYSRLPSPGNREACAGKPSIRPKEDRGDSPRPRRARTVMQEHIAAQINVPQESAGCSRVRIVA